MKNPTWKAERENSQGVDSWGSDVNRREGGQEGTGAGWDELEP